jgi:FtsZ-binding cell division protein ZapB
MEDDDLEERVDQAVDEMRSHVEELKRRRDELEERTEEARRAPQRMEEATPGSQAHGNDDKDADDEASPEDR